MSIAPEQRTLPVIDCAGSYRDRGRQQGEQLRDTIAAVVERWCETLAQRHGMEAQAYIAEFLANTNYLPAIERFTPGLLDEVRGIAEGAGLSFETMLAYNLMDEEWQYAGERSGQGPGCTVACLAPASGPAIVAQTMDIPSVHDDSQVAVRHQPADGVETIVFTGAGMLGLNGANVEGIGVVVNNLSMLPSSRSGLPVMFVLRGILERTTLADAAAFVETVPHAIGQHYAIGSPDGLVGLEGAANGVARANTAGVRYVHANHPIANDAVVGDPSAAYAASRTFERHARAAELLDGVDNSAGIEAALTDVTVPISRAPKGGFMTFGGISIACTAPPVVRIAPGPPHETPWTTVGF